MPSILVIGSTADRRYVVMIAAIMLFGVASGRFTPCQKAFSSSFRRTRAQTRWTRVKKRLSFCRLIQDGDDEGIMILRNLPTAAQAEAIREAIGLHKKRQVAEATLMAMRDALRPGV
jgi:hypothetical protein